MGEELRTLSTPLEALRDRIASREAKVGVIGLGAVGFAVARAAHAAGHPVLGHDIDEGLIARLQKAHIFADLRRPDVLRVAPAPLGLAGRA